MKKQWQIGRDHPSLMHYPISESIEKSKTAYNQLTIFKDEVDKWVPVLDYQSHRARTRELITVYEDALADVHSYKTIMEETNRDIVKDMASQKRHSRLERDKYVAAFKEKGSACAPCVAKVCGDMLYYLAAEAQLPKDAPRGSSLAGAELGSANVSGASFGHPCLLKAGLETGSHWHSECDKRVAKITAAAEAKYDEALKEFGTNETRFVVWHSLATTDPDFNWNAPAPPGIFECLAGVRIPLGSARCGHCRAELAEFPYKTVGHFYHQISGRAIIIVLRPQQLQDHPNIGAWLAALPSTALSKLSAFYVDTRDSVWVPFGSMPLIIGVPAGRICPNYELIPAKSDAVPAAPHVEAIQYALTLCYDNSDEKQDAALRSYVSSIILQTQPFVFKGIKSVSGPWEARLRVGLDSIADE